MRFPPRKGYDLQYFLINGDDATTKETCRGGSSLDLFFSPLIRVYIENISNPFSKSSPNCLIPSLLKINISPMLERRKNVQRNK